MDLNVNDMISDWLENDYDRITEWLREGNARITSMGDLELWSVSDTNAMEELEDTNPEAFVDIYELIVDHVQCNGNGDKWAP